MFSLPVIVTVCVVIVAAYLTGRAQGYHTGRESGAWVYKMLDLPSNVELICSSMNPHSNFCTVRRAKVRWWFDENYWEVAMNAHAQSIFGKHFKFVWNENHQREIRLCEDSKEVVVGFE